MAMGATGGSDIVKGTASNLIDWSRWWFRWEECWELPNDLPKVFPDGREGRTMEFLRGPAGSIILSVNSELQLW